MHSAVRKIDTTEGLDDGYRPGLEGVVAFRTEIAEPDRDGGALRYRGVNIEDLAGTVTFGDVWSLLVDGRFGNGLPPAEPFPIPVHTGDVRVDVQAALAMLAPIWDYRPLLDITDTDAREQLARASVMALSYVAQSARGIGVPAVPQARIDQCSTITETRARSVRTCSSSMSSSWPSPQYGASMATADCTSTRMSPECTGTGKGSAGGSPGPNRPSTSNAQTLPNETWPIRSSMSTPR